MAKKRERAGGQRCPLLWSPMASACGSRVTSVLLLSLWAVFNDLFRGPFFRRDSRPGFHLLEVFTGFHLTERESEERDPPAHPFLWKNHCHHAILISPTAAILGHPPSARPGPGCLAYTPPFVLFITPRSRHDHPHFTDDGTETKR